MAKLRVGRLPFFAIGIVALLWGMSLGLARLGWPILTEQSGLLVLHGPLMVCGFLGTVIGLERAVALGRLWAFTAPAFTALAVLLLPFGAGHSVAALLFTMASLVLLFMCGVLLRQQPSLFVTTMLAGGACWLVGNLLWLGGRSVFALVVWWLGFPVLTIAGERLELSRLRPPSTVGRITFVIISATLLGAAWLATVHPREAPRLLGLTLLALALWLTRYDVARHTLRQGGVARFAATCLLSGYAWLGIGGVLMTVASGEFIGPIYDACLHAVFVGFVFAMIFGHAPIIFPAVLGGRSLFSRRFYAPLVLLHISLILRIGGDLSSAWLDGAWARARAWGGALGVVAILGFLASTALSLRVREVPRSRPGGRASSPLDFLPARWLPLLYFGFGHVALAVAFATIAANPAGIAGFYYHPRLVAVVHMVTLGWISGSILGALYLVLPLAFRTAFLAGWADYMAFIAFAVGVTGMVAHFWINRLIGVAWAATLVLAVFLFVGTRVVVRLRRAPVPGEARLPIVLAFFNVLAAAAAGVLLAVNKQHPFLPAPQLRIVIGHAHLAVLGWASMMVIGAGYRLLPMMLPAAAPRGSWPYLGTLLLQFGTWGIFLSALAGGGVPWFAASASSGIVIFLSQVVWMFHHRRPAPADRLRPDLAVGHVVQALLCLIGSVVVGGGLALSSPSEAALRWTMAYGVLALIGFLSQMVIGVAGRLVPLYAWLWGFADRHHKELPPSQYRAIPRAGQALVLLVWTVGVPTLALGLALDHLRLIRAAAATLACAVLVSAASLCVALFKLWHRGPASGGSAIVSDGSAEVVHA